MSVNSSSISDGPLDYHCSTSKARPFVLIGVTAVKAILILPLSTFIIHMGYQQWRRQRSFNTASHSDLFTYHLAAMELSWGFGLVCYLCGLYRNSLVVIILGLCALSVTFYGELFFHLLTCIERYLAVVHPITYRGLRNARGVRIRNITIGCVWVLTFGLIGVNVDSTQNYATISIFFLLGFSVIVMSFCSISVLFVLIRPGPGEGGGDKDCANHSKRRAFYTVTAITSVLWLWFLGLIISSALEQAQLDESITCVLTASLGFFNLPASLVLPLLYLHRAGKLFSGCSHERM